MKCKKSFPQSGFFTILRVILDISGDMHYGEWPGFVVNTVAMTFQIMEKTVAEPVVFASRIT